PPEAVGRNCCSHLLDAVTKVKPFAVLLPLKQRIISLPRIPKSLSLLKILAPRALGPKPPIESRNWWVTGQMMKLRVLDGAGSYVEGNKPRGQKIRPSGPSLLPPYCGKSRIASFP